MLFYSLDGVREIFLLQRQDRGRKEVRKGRGGGERETDNERG